MCVIFQVSAEANLTADEITAASVNNSDGWGVAFPDKQADGRTLVQWYKGLSTEQMLDIRESLEGISYVAHARMATAGGTGVELTHPFPVTPKAGLAIEGVAKKVLFHNGHWGGWERTRDALTTVRKFEGRKQEFPKGAWSDSRFLAYLLAHYDIETLGEEINAAGKLAIVGVDSVVTYGDFSKVRDGIFASNMYWDTKYANSGYGAWWDDKDDMASLGQRSSILYGGPPGPTLYRTPSSVFAIGDTVQIDCSKATFIDPKYHGECVRIEDVGATFSKVTSYGPDVPLLGNRRHFPNCCFVDVADDIGELVKVAGPLVDIAKIKVGQYVEYLEPSGQNKGHNVYGRIIRRTKTKTGDTFHVWNAAEAKASVIVASDFVRHFPPRVQLAARRIK